MSYSVGLGLGIGAEQVHLVPCHIVEETDVTGLLQPVGTKGMRGQRLKPRFHRNRANARDQRLRSNGCRFRFEGDGSGGSHAACSKSVVDCASALKARMKSQALEARLAALTMAFASSFRTCSQLPM